VLGSILFGRVLRLHGEPEGWRVILASSLAGVRGAVTLAGVLSFPLMLPNGAPFPGRDLAVTLSTGVILCSMLIAAVGLPLLLRGSHSNDHDAERELRLARIAAADAGIRVVTTTEASPDVRQASLIAVYRERLAKLQTDGSAEREDRRFRSLQRAALHAERKAVQDLRSRGTISDPVARQLLGELDLIEAAAHSADLRT
jgi:CPA1 family monovalent cation:H+ antiporter